MSNDFQSTLAHYGVKGMKWGVRNDGTPHTRRSAKKEAKADAKWEKSIYTVSGAIKVHNATADYVNARLGTLNDKYSDDDLYDPVTKQKYESDYMTIVNAGYKSAVSSVHGKSPSGKKQAVMSEDGSRIEVRDVEVKHADFEGDEPDLVFLLKRNTVGRIIEMNKAELAIAQSEQVEEFFLAHYGVKGMKWGVRRSPSQLAEASATQKKPGGKIVTKGGGGKPASADALNAAKIRQTAKASRTDALSNAELQEAIKRMQLEQQYSQLSKGTENAGLKFVKRLLGDTAQQQGQSVFQTQAAYQVDQALTKRGQPIPAKSKYKFKDKE